MRRSGEPATLSGFLEEVALVADIDSLEEDSDYVVLMTLHSAKRTGISTGIPGRYGRRRISSYMCITSRMIKRARLRKSAGSAHVESQEQSRS